MRKVDKNWTSLGAFNGWGGHQIVVSINYGLRIEGVSAKSSGTGEGQDGHESRRWSLKLIHIRLSRQTNLSKLLYSIAGNAISLGKFSTCAYGPHRNAQRTHFRAYPSQTAP